MAKKIIIYCDMDGVLANFNQEPKALERFESEKGFFKKLKPIKENVDAILDLIGKNYDVRILSTSPNAQADKDKRKWLKKYLGIERHKIILARPNIPKIDYLTKRQKTRAILIDDYGKNINEWFEGGGLHAIKITPEPKESEVDYLSVKHFAKVLESIL